MVGRTLLHYRITCRLGAGGMGEVYRATDERLGRDVALKVLSPVVASDPDRLKRFRLEARALAALDHPNIVTVHSVEEADGVHFLTMNLVEGEPLERRIGAPMAVREFLDIAEALGSGLAAAHDKGIVHRDLKPANVMMTPRGQVKILDFGLAKVEEPEKAVADVTQTRMLTQAGITMGTVPYMSPEQAEGKPLDSRTDLFSLGVMFYEMLAGIRPFDGGTAAALVSSILKDTPRPLKDVRTDLPPSALHLVGRCLEKNRARRYQTARALLDELATARRELETGVASSRSIERPSIAVLPFADMSPGKDHDWFCEGMAEELINRLSGLSRLRVAARASAFQMRGQDVRRVGELLQVRTVLDGSLRTAGQRLRVTAQLNDASDGYQIWSKRYDRDMDDVFAVQDDIASDIVDALAIELGSDTPSHQRQTHDVEAYHLYLKGRHHFFRRTRAEMDRSEGFFVQALERDPGYALALTGLGDLYAISAFYGMKRAPEAIARARELSDRAMEIDRELSEAYVTGCFVEGYCSLHWQEAVSHARRAVALNSTNVVALLWGAATLSSAGVVGESVEWIERARLLDPLSPYAAALAAFMYLLEFRNEEALRCAESALALDPNHPVALYFSAGAYGRCNRPQEAVRCAERAVSVVGRLPFYLGWLGWALALNDQPHAAREILDELRRRATTEYVPWVTQGWLHGALGETDAALRCFERSIPEHEPAMGMIHVPPFDPLRDETRFAELLERCGYTRGPRQPSSGS